MAYAQVSDVAALAPQITIDGTTKPNTAMVQVMIAHAERDLDAALTNLGYVTPVTAPVSVSILRDKIAHAVLARLIRSRAFGVTDPAEQGANDAERVYRDWLRAIADSRSPVELPDAARTGEAIEKDAADLIGSHVQDSEVASVQADQPVFSRTMVF